MKGTVVARWRQYGERLGWMVLIGVMMGSIGEASLKVEPLVGDQLKIKGSWRGTFLEARSIEKRALKTNRQSGRIIGRCGFY